MELTEVCEHKKEKIHVGFVEDDMILGFMKTWNKGRRKGEPTYFKNKIEGCFDTGAYRPKLHTLRVDKSARWHAGRMIHFATGVRTKSMEIFFKERMYRHATGCD